MHATSSAVCAHQHGNVNRAAWKLLDLLNLLNLFNLLNLLNLISLLNLLNLLSLFSLLNLLSLLDFIHTGISHTRNPTSVAPWQAARTAALFRHEEKGSLFASHQPRISGQLSLACTR